MADTRSDQGFFTARDGLRIFWQTTRPAGSAAAHIALLHGYAEHLGRQQTITDALVKAGYAVHRIDCRGHGQSGGKRAFVDKFADYLSDLDLLLARVREEAAGRPVYLLGHSHGALISARYLLDKPAAVKGAILCAPYLRLKLPVPALKIWAGKLIARVIPSLPMKNTLKPEMLTRDPEIQKATAADPLYLQYATPGWFVAASAAQEEVLRRASELTVPLFIFHGGADPIADPVASRELFDGATSKDKTYKLYDGLVHELFHEPERETVFRDVIGWLDERRAQGTLEATGARG